MVNLPMIQQITQDITDTRYIKSSVLNSQIGENVKLNGLHHLTNSSIGNYTYISENSKINNATIGRFCSIGPNLICGWGIHPINGISTSPMFYSTLKQNGITLSSIDKIQEIRPVTIGNDVFIGANVTILDGIIIGDGAVIAAGAVVNKNVPAYSIVGGVPAKIIKYRFNNAQIESLIKIKWWEFDAERLNDIEKMFFNVDDFIEKYSIK